jgi:heptosyltransferase-2
MSARATERLFVLLPKAVGDIVLNIPAVELLIEAGFELSLGGPSFSRDLMSHIGCGFSNAGSNEELRSRLRELNGACVLNMRSSLTSALLIRGAGLPSIGYRGQYRTLLLWKTLRRPRGLLKVDEYHRLAQFASAVCRRAPKPTTWASAPYPSLPVTEEQSRRGQALLASAGVDGPYAVCCVTAAPRYRPGWKIWSGFPEFQKLLAASGLRVVTCPGRGEEELCAEMAPGSTMLEGVDLITYAAIMRGAEAVVSNDTGSMHLAAAVGAPTLGIFGDTSPGRHAPWGERAAHVGELGRWPTVEEAWGAFGKLKGDCR